VGDGFLGDIWSSGKGAKPRGAATGNRGSARERTAVPGGQMEMDR
jgi:hypothetical protein